MKRILASALVAAALAAPGAGQARPGHEGNGCTVIAPKEGGGANCRYIASGPGDFTVSSFISHYRIETTRDGGKTWIILAHSQAVRDERGPVYPPGAPPVFAPTTGTIATLPGDVVDVRLNLQRVCAGDCQLVRAGYISAGDAG